MIKRNSSSSANLKKLTARSSRNAEWTLSSYKQMRRKSDGFRSLDQKLFDDIFKVFDVKKLGVMEKKHIYSVVK